MSLHKKLISERNIFILILVINCVFILAVRFYPSMDGPCHLYNSNLITHLIKGSQDGINNYFILNHAPIPNWISYFILSFFNSFLPAWGAEKILLIAYLIGLAVSFRLLIKQLCPENIGLSILILPFAYSFLFHLGFYNYSISFIFMFLTLYYWLKYQSDTSLKKYMLLFTLITLTYFSAILTFFFLGLTLGLFVLAFSINNYLNGNSLKKEAKAIIRELILLLIISSPALIFSAIFIGSTTYSTSGHRYSYGELITWVNDVRSIIVYNYTEERVITEQIMHIMIALVSVSLFLRFHKTGTLFSSRIYRRSDILLIPIALAFCFLFIIPDGSNAGMMSDRFCLMFFMLLVLWTVAQRLPPKVVTVFIAFIIVIHLGLLTKHHFGTIVKLSKDAETIYYSSGYIKENSVVLPVNMTDNWLEPHFSNYLGVDKPMIILENYEAQVGWFPVRWNTREMPRIKLCENDGINGIQWDSNINSTTIKQIDYVFLFGNTNKINDESWTELKIVLDQNFTLSYTTEDNYAAVYSRVLKNE